VFDPGQSLRQLSPSAEFQTDRAAVFGLPYSQIGLACWGRVYGRAHVNSTLKIQKSELTLIEKIKAEIKKRSEAKAKRMLLKRPRRLTNR
jgi:hypothetical protein